MVHLWYLIGFANRLLVVIRWAFSFLGHGRGARLITGEPQPASVVDAVSRIPARSGQEDIRARRSRLTASQLRRTSTAQPTMLVVTTKRLT